MMQKTSAPPRDGHEGLDHPYVGLRPYEASERSLFYGRGRDAQRLGNKILSSPLTLLYAQSSIGKSSLLRALVIPQLEAEGCRVFYYDVWTDEDPAEALKSFLAQKSTDLGLPQPSTPTLVELVRLIASTDDRSQILVLDQFEEFLLAHGQHLDPLRKELAALLRAKDLDAHVVLALREEFLAALEPFRHSILDLFQSTYRLEALDDDCIRTAIEQPAKQFGAAYESALLDVLLEELRPKGRSDASSGTRPPVDLPTLQLVCSQLWDKARGARLIPLSLYDRIGRAEKILNKYVRDVMPRGWRDELLTAQLMRYLAPPSGYKISYSIDDLVAMTHLPRQRIDAELERLSRKRILRVRGFGAGARYELEHDAFIKFIEPWRDQKLAQAGRWRLGSRFAIFLVLLLFLLSVAPIISFFSSDNIVDLNTKAAGHVIAKSIPLAVKTENSHHIHSTFDPIRDEYRYFDIFCVMDLDGEIAKKTKTDGKTLYCNEDQKISLVDEFSELPSISQFLANPLQIHQIAYRSFSTLKYVRSIVLEEPGKPREAVGYIFIKSRYFDYFNIHEHATKFSILTAGSAIFILTIMLCLRYLVYR